MRVVLTIHVRTGRRAGLDQAEGHRAAQAARGRRRQGHERLRCCRELNPPPPPPFFPLPDGHGETRRGPPPKRRAGLAESPHRAAGIYMGWWVGGIGVAHSNSGFLHYKRSILLFSSCACGWLLLPPPRAHAASIPMNADLMAVVSVPAQAQADTQTGAWPRRLLLNSGSGPRRGLWSVDYRGERLWVA